MENYNQQGCEMPPNLDKLEAQFDEMKADMREMRSAVTEMAKAMSKLAILEERNLATNQTIEKVVNKVDKLETKVNNNELEQVKFIANVDGVSKTMKFMWAAFGSGVLYIGSQIIKTFSHQ